MDKYVARGSKRRSFCVDVGIVFVFTWAACACLATSQEDFKGTRDYCQWEKFNATCGPDEVILMTTADYGRMRLGRCLLRDYGYVGCKDDVLRYVDSKCSGRHNCIFNIPDPVLDMLQPCPGDLKSYMQASYGCLKVVTGGGQICRGSSFIKLTDPSGVIASTITEEMQIGSSACPWLIEAGKGQRVVVTLHDFALWTSEDRDRLATPRRQAERHRPIDTAGICHIYAQIREKTATTSVTLCGGDQREKVVYTSESESVQVEVANMRNVNAKDSAHFLLSYQVIGCAHVPPSPNIVVERHGDVARITCKATDESWELTCVGSTWKGKPKNCTDVKAWGLTHFIENAISLPQSVLIVIILGIALLIAVIILAVGLCTLRRRQNEATRNKGTALIATTGSTHYAGRRSVTDTSGKEHYPMLANPDRGQNDRRNESEYTSTWQRRTQVPATRLFPDGTIRRIEYEARSMDRGGNGFMQPPYSPEMTSSPMRPFGSPSQHQVEHIYESPKFERKNGRRYDGDYSDAPFYHELDPDRLSDSSAQPDVVVNTDVGYQHASVHGAVWPDSNSNMAVMDGNMCAHPLNDLSGPDLPPPNLNEL